MNVFPAPMLKEVSVITLRSCVWDNINPKLVRRMRNDSDNASSPRARTTTSCTLAIALGVCGISARKGALTMDSISFRLCTPVSSINISSRITEGTITPQPTPNRSFLYLLGEIGMLLPETGSRTRALLSTIACLNAFSSRLFNRNIYRDSLTFCCLSIDNISRCLRGTACTFWRTRFS